LTHLDAALQTAARFAAWFRRLDWRQRLVAIWAGYTLFTVVWSTSLTAAAHWTYWTRDRWREEPRTVAPPALVAEGRAAYKKGDATRAMEILLPLAEAGDREAQYFVGYLYDYSIVFSDRCEATKWYDRAARQGYPPAQYVLAFAYLGDSGVYADAEKAYRWALAASRNGVEAATEWLNLGLFSDALSTAEREAIDRDMETWRPEDEPPALVIRIPDFPLAGTVSFVPDPCKPLAD
jgi:tetratricopeptide (TPR) repeat protein